MNKEMLRMKPKASRISSPAKGGAGGGEAGGWEVRPGGMLVQKRNTDSYQNPAVGQPINVGAKYGSSYHEINISSHASFGPTGLLAQDQKLMYKDKERDSKVSVDFAGVKNGSKHVLSEDESSRERRSHESRSDVKMEKASKEILAIRFEVDQLAKQVAAVEMEISGGKRVMESVLLNLIELLMTQLIKLDGIAAEGDLKLQRRLQVKRVQKYIEALDVLKLGNSAIENGSPKVTILQQQQHRIFTGHKMATTNHQGNFERSPRSVVLTTDWENF